MNKESQKQYKILIIDDDPGMVRLLESKLGHRGFSILSTDDASAGLEMAVKKSPDLIVLDVMMPMINGYNICRLLKEEEKLTVPVVMLTGRTTDEDKQIGKEVGADAYLTKPLDPNELYQTIDRLLNRA